MQLPPDNKLAFPVRQNAVLQKARRDVFVDAQDSVERRFTEKEKRGSQRGKRNVMNHSTIQGRKSSDAIATTKPATDAYAPNETRNGVRELSLPPARLVVSDNENTATQGEISPRLSVLVVDDEEMVASVLARGLSYAGYETLTARSGAEALEKLDSRHFDALLTDIHMPRMRGDELQRIARERNPDLAVLLITAADEKQCAIQCLKEGVLDYLTKPFELADVVQRVGDALYKRRSRLEAEARQRYLEQRVIEQADRLKRTLQGSLESLIHALEAKDPHTRNHSARVADLATALAAQLRPDDLHFCARVRVAALFHDIGKIGVPEAVLNKNGKLEEAEMDLVRRHPEIGETILRPLLDAETTAIVRSHHEHFDGRGYPDKSAGEDIPLGGRIVAVADAYDAMSSTRPYRSEITRRRVLEILHRGAGHQWDDQVVDALLALVVSGRLADTGEGRTTVADAVTIASEINDARDALSDDAYIPLRLPAGNAKTPRLLPVPPPAPNAPINVNIPPVVFMRGHIDADAIHAARTQIEMLLRKGERNLVVDLSDAVLLTPASAQCMYALDLQAKRAGARIALRAPSEPIMMVLRSTGLARMLHFE